MRVFLPYPPSANERLTVRKGGGGFVNTAKYRAWKEEASWIVAMAVRDKANKIKGPYTLDVVARPPPLNRRRDLDNLIKATSDALTAGGAVEDDSLCQRVAIEWGPLDSPGVLIGVQPCPHPISPVDGSAKSPSGNEPKSPRPSRRRNPRGATIQAAKSGGSSDTDSPGCRASGRPPSSTLAESIVLLKGLKNKPKT
jgi:crossover junction endodeoxyribonuclease RusA